MSETLKDLRNMVAMFSQVPGINKDFNDVDDKSLVHVPEHLIHEALEFGR